MINSNRCKFDIIAAILRVARKPALKTHILYKCNLSFNQLKIYLDALKHFDLLMEKDGKYETTQRGVQYLKDYAEVVATFHGAAGGA